MTLLTRDEALKVLTLVDRNDLTRLAKRQLLIPVKLGTKTYRYKKRDCELLLERVVNEGINLKLR